MEILEYSPSGKEQKSQTDIAKKQYENLDTYKIIEEENYSKSNLMYDTNHIFYRYYRNIKKKLTTFLSNQNFLFRTNFLMIYVN